MYDRIGNWVHRKKVPHLVPDTLQVHIPDAEATVIRWYREDSTHFLDISVVLSEVGACFVAEVLATVVVEAATVVFGSTVMTAKEHEHLVPVPDRLVPVHGGLVSVPGEHVVVYGRLVLVPVIYGPVPGCGRLVLVLGGPVPEFDRLVSMSGGLEDEGEDEDEDEIVVLVCC